MHEWNSSNTSDFYVSFTLPWPHPTKVPNTPTRPHHMQTRNTVTPQPTIQFTHTTGTTPPSAVTHIQKPSLPYTQTYWMPLSITILVTFPKKMTMYRRPIIQQVSAYLNDIIGVSGISRWFSSVFPYSSRPDWHPCSCRTVMIWHSDRLASVRRKNLAGSSRISSASTHPDRHPATVPGGDRNIWTGSQVRRGHYKQVISFLWNDLCMRSFRGKQYYT